MKIGIADLEVATRAEAEVDGLKNRRLTAVARTNEAVETVHRKPSQLLDPAKILNFNQSNARQSLFPQFGSRPNRTYESGRSLNSSKPASALRTK